MYRYYMLTDPLNTSGNIPHPNLKSCINISKPSTRRSESYTLSIHHIKARHIPYHPDGRPTRHHRIYHGLYSPCSSLLLLLPFKFHENVHLMSGLLPLSPKVPTEQPTRPILARSSRSNYRAGWTAESHDLSLPGLWPTGSGFDYLMR